MLSSAQTHSIKFCWAGTLHQISIVSKSNKSTLWVQFQNWQLYKPVTFFPSALIVT